MSDLRQFAAELIANPLVPVPPVEGVVARAHRYQAARRRRQIGAGLCLVAMTMMAVARAGVGVGDRHSVRMVGEPPSAEERGTTTTTVVPSFGGDAGTFPTLPWSGQSFDGDWSQLRERQQCPVVASRVAPIRILAGNPSELVRELVAMLNNAGGICGRTLELVRGSTAGADLSKFDVVLASSFDSSVDEAIVRGLIAAAGIPVVSDGLSELHHNTPSVYPVGPSAAAMTRTAVRHARDRGAKSFAIVYDAHQAFGREAAQSFDEYVRRSGGTVKASIGLDPSATAYAPEAERVTSRCGVDGCDFLLLAVLPETAKAWLKTNPVKPRVQLAGLSTVLAKGYEDHCAAAADQWCDGLLAWSGFVPSTPAEPWNIEADYAYGQSGSAIGEGNVLAVRALFEAAFTAGVDANRTSLRRAFESMTFTTRIAPPLSWPLPGQVAQAWALRTPVMVPQVSTAGGSPDPGSVKRAAAPEWYPVGTGWVQAPL